MPYLRFFSRIKISRFKVGVFAATMLSISSACGTQQVKTTRNADGAECPVPRDGSHIGVPKSLAELTRASTLIVQGTIVKSSVESVRDVNSEAQIREKIDSYNKANPPSRIADPNIKNGGDPDAVAPIVIATTISTVRLARVFRGAAKPGDNVLLASPGDNITTCTEFDPIPDHDVPYVLFLTSAGDGSDRFVVAGGSKRGRYIVTNGILRGIRNGAEGLADVAGQTVEDLAKSIDQLPPKTGG